MLRKQTVLAVFIGVLASFSLAVMALGGETPTTPGGGETSTTATTASTPDAQAAQTYPAPANPQPAETPPPKSDPKQADSVIALLQESDTAMKAASDNHKGVHVVERSFFSIEGESSSFISEGDLMLPDRAKLLAEIRLPKRQQPAGWDSGPLVVEAISIGDTLYLKPDFSNNWSVCNMSEDTDPLISDVEMEAIHFYDYISSSKNLGQESFSGGVTATHVQVEIDTAKLIDKIKSEIDPAKASKYGSQLDKLKTSTITSEIWIGTDDKLVYQVSSKFNNSDLQMASDDLFCLSNWGEVVDISAPV